jgi:hypothetical protein
MLSFLVGGETTHCRVCGSICYTAQPKCHEHVAGLRQVNTCKTHDFVAFVVPSASASHGTLPECASAECLEGGEIALGLGNFINRGGTYGMKEIPGLGRTRHTARHVESLANGHQF